MTLMGGEQKPKQNVQQSGRCECWFAGVIRERKILMNFVARATLYAHVAPIRRNYALLRGTSKSKARYGMFFILAIVLVVLWLGGFS